MSALPDAHAAPHLGSGEHGPSGRGSARHGSRRGYLIGFALSVLLTAIPFWLIIGHEFTHASTAALTVMAFAGAQMVVHMIFFLHMTPQAEGGWSLLALIFTLVIVGITLSGSLWVMYHLNANMMPMSVRDMRNMP
jgi:cytochrome o ubiquinol oxidase operon protein cyoD